MRLLVIGGSGLVGSNVVELGTDRADAVLATHLSTETAHTDTQLDKSDPDETTRVIEDFQPDAIVDTAAFHAVDDCEVQRDRAWSVNAAGTRNVAAGANAVDAHLVYLSTDYVFRGDPTETPYRETDPVDPVNYYAETKYAGEQAAKVADMATVLRSSVVYGGASANFVTWALGELETGNELTIVDDQISTPTYAPDLAKASLACLDRDLTGLFHAAGPERLSRYDFTVTLANVYDYDPELVTPISTEDLGQDAPRPEDSTLDSSQLYDAIEYDFLSPQQAFQEMYRKDHEG